MADDSYLQTEVEFDIDTTNPREFGVHIKSKHKDMTAVDIYDALCYLVHDILEPELFGEKKDGTKN